ncbi:MAG: hypothetical protein WCO83_02400 [Alphaproteobacteria bacterium]
MKVQTAVVRMLDTATTIHTKRAKLRAALEALSDVAGFPATVAAFQAELQSLAERARRIGQPTGGWIA